MRGFRLDARLHPQVPGPRAQPEGTGVGDHQVLAQPARQARQGSGDLIRRREAQEALGEVPAQLVPGRRGPPRRAGPGEAAEDPAHLRERAAVLGFGGDALLKRGPAAHPVLAGDGQLGVVQGGELSRGQPPLRLELAVAQAQAVREVAGIVVGGSPWLIRQGCLSSRPRVRVRRAGKTCLHV